jgi:transposase
VPPKPIRRLRDLTRYRRTLVRDRTREKQRLEKLLEDAQIKLSTVASNILGVSGRAMLEAMIAGERDPKVLAHMARARMRAKISQLEEALHGHFDDHHALICQMMLERIDEVTGIGTTAAQDLIAELGVDMGVFPTAAHLVS